MPLSNQIRQKQLVSEKEWLNPDKVLRTIPIPHSSDYYQNNIADDRTSESHDGDRSWRKREGRGDNSDTVKKEIHTTQTRASVPRRTMYEQNTQNVAALMAATYQRTDLDGATSRCATTPGVCSITPSSVEEVVRRTSSVDKSSKYEERSM